MPRFPIVCALFAALSSCGDGFVTRATTVAFDPAATDFWAVPLPSELRLQEDGTYNYERWPGGRPALVKMWLDTIDRRVNGWGVNSGVFFTTSGPVDPASLTVAASSLADGAAVQFIDVDQTSPEYGRRFPLDVTFTADEVPYSPANLLAVVPTFGFPRRDRTTYAVILTDQLKDAAGKPLGASLAFHRALERQPGADPKAVAALAPLRAYLDEKKLDRSHVVGGTVFTTIDASASLVKLSAWVEALPAPTLTTPFTRIDAFPEFTLYAGSYTVPQVQSGPRPGRGHIVWNDAGDAPVQTGSQEVRLSVSIPTTPMPAGGYPLMIYFHGSGGEYREGMDRGPLPPTTTRDLQGEPPPGTGPAAWLGKRGVAVMGFDFPLHGNRETPPDTTGRELYDIFGDIDSSVDNMQVAAMEVTYMTRLLSSMTVTEGADTFRFDVTKLSAMGHSMGSTLGIPIASVDPRIKGYVFSGAGGLIIELANSTSYPVELKGAIELLLGFGTGQSLSRSNPLLHAFQALWDFTDPSAKARFVAQAPHPGHEPHPYFVPQGLIDGYFHPLAQTSVDVALGATLVGPELDATMPDASRLAGRDTQAAFPLASNLNGVTAGSVQVQTPFQLGHYVAFDRDDVRHQVTCFVLGVGSASGPVLVGPGGLEDACP